MSAATKTQKKSQKAATKSKSVLSAEELAAMKATIKERKMAANKEEGEQAALAAIAAMKEPDRSKAKRVHALIQANAPGLSAKTWYGMPAYADAEGKVVCFFQAAEKFKYRYPTLGFQDAAHLDDGGMWPVAFALQELNAANEERIAALLKRAVSG
ncbi:MAG TPA: DUF1801 domain-containing protein [Anaerolineales bacterium]|nr:DUF1801 domain-containing protein [Anaerolineales bacterium]